MSLYDSYIKNSRQRELLQLANKLAKKFSLQADEIDCKGCFPYENFEDLRESNYTSLTVPEKYGGRGINLYEFIMLQERIASGDAATALSIGWHLGIILEMVDDQSWSDEQFENIATLIVNENALINRAATEPGSGPTRGGMPETKAVRTENGWVINGRKTFTSMAPGLSHALVSAQIDETGKKGFYLVDMSGDGITIEETWDTMSMRGTRSDDLLLENVSLPLDALIEQSDNEARDSLPKAWLLHIPACYLGVAIAARNYALNFAREYQPNSLPGPIKDVPEVQRKIGEMELELMRAREMMYSVAWRWVSEPKKRVHMGEELAAVKHVATNAAANVVDLAMRIVGARGLFKDNPMQRYYRDVRAGLHNPPMDDAVISMLAAKAIDESQEPSS